MSVSMAWSAVILEKWFSRMVRVPVRATCPQPQKSATPEKHRMVATRDAYGTPPRHLIQHSKQPAHTQTLVTVWRALLKLSRFTFLDTHALNTMYTRAVWYIQCWGKLLLKVMHYNVALLHKKVITLLIYVLWKVMRYVTFELLFKSGKGLLVCF